MTETTSSYPDTRLLIAGEWRDATGGKKIAVANPATGQTIGHVAHASIADLDAALAAAQSGFDKWRNVPAADPDFLLEPGHFEAHVAVHGPIPAGARPCRGSRSWWWR